MTYKMGLLSIIELDPNSHNEFESFILQMILLKRITNY